MNQKQKEMLQAFFDKTAIHLLTQGKRSTGPCPNKDGGMTERCLYRNNEGLMCAIGVHIPDESYSSDMEGSLPSETGLLRPSLWGDHTIPESLQFAASYSGEFPFSFALRLQFIHDNEAISSWPSALIDFANDYGLKYDHIPGLN